MTGDPHRRPSDDHQPIAELAGTIGARFRDLARVHLLTGDPDGACELVTDAPPLLDHRHPGRLARKLGDFDREAVRYADLPSVRDTRTRLRALVSAQRVPRPPPSNWENAVRIGITGHSNLAPSAEPAVVQALTDVLASTPAPLVGSAASHTARTRCSPVSCSTSGGEVEVVLPAADYRERKVKPDNAAAFGDLIGRASTIRTLPCERSGREAYLAASEAVLGTVDRIVAVRDGQPSDGHSGTAVTERVYRHQPTPAGTRRERRDHGQPVRLDTQAVTQPGPRPRQTDQGIACSTATGIGSGSRSRW